MILGAREDPVDELHCRVDVLAVVRHAQEVPSGLAHGHVVALHVVEMLIVHIDTQLGVFNLLDFLLADSIADDVPHHVSHQAGVEQVVGHVFLGNGVEISLLAIMCAEGNSKRLLFSRSY